MLIRRGLGGTQTKMKNKIFLLIFIMNLAIVSALTITPISTPSGVTSSPTVNIQYNVTTDYLSEMKWNWDNTNYSLYDDSLVLFYNFDNRSALGENDTYVADLSQYGNNGTVIGGENISWTQNGNSGFELNFEIGGITQWIMGIGALIIMIIIVFLFTSVLCEI